MSDDVLEGGLGDFKASVKGPNAIYVALLAVALGVIGYILWVDVRENRIISHEEHLTIQQGLDEMVYVQSLNEEDRKKLQLTMPESLAKKRRFGQ